MAAYSQSQHVGRWLELLLAGTGKGHSTVVWGQGEDQPLVLMAPGKGTAERCGDKVRINPLL